MAKTIKMEWCAEDIRDIAKSIRPEWTLKQCQDFIDNNRNHILNNVSDAAVEVISTLIECEDDFSEEEDD